MISVFWSFWCHLLVWFQELFSLEELVVVVLLVVTKVVVFSLSLQHNRRET